MASAEQLKSGSFRCRAKKVINGKTVVRSFTVSPNAYPGTKREREQKAKLQAELLAREWMLSKKAAKYGKTVGDAMKSYIEDRYNMLKDTTIRGYNYEMKSLSCIADMYIEDVDKQVIQRLINDLMLTLSPKSIRNKINFLLSALDYAGSEMKYKVKLPTIPDREPTTPDHDELDLILSNSKGEFKTMIMISAFGGLRRGEIAALKQKDILRDMSMIYVHSDITRAVESGYVHNDSAKTYSSTRTVSIPKELMRLIPESDNPEDYVFTIPLDKITRRFTRLRNKLGLNCRFHDLRHYSASMRSDLGVPDKYVKNQLGWSDKSNVYKDVYDNPFASESAKYRKLTNKYINENFGEHFKNA